MPLSVIAYGASCPWPQNLRKPRANKHPNRIRVIVSSYVDGRELRRVSENEARVMCAENADGSDMLGEDGKPLEPVAVRLSRIKAPLTEIRLLAPLRDDRASPCTLTKSDAEKNAIVYIGARIAPTDSIRALDRAVNKVKAWPATHDDRAPVISAGSAYGVFCPYPSSEERVVTFA